MKAAIAGWGHYAPVNKLTNSDLEKLVDTNDAWITERTGIKERRIVSPGESTSTMAIEAGKAAIKSAGITPEEVGLLIVATTTPDKRVPQSATVIANELGCRTNIGCFDLNAACAGFIYSLVTANAFVTAGFDNILVIGSETMSQVPDPTDRGTCILFGDAAGACVLRSSGQDGPGILSWDIGADGSLEPLIHIPAGGSKLPLTPEGLAAGDQFVKMNGKEVYKRAVRIIVDSSLAALAAANKTLEDVTWFVPHQANARIIDGATNRLGITADQTIMNIERYGNTSAASIGVAIAEAAEEDRFAPGDILLLTGFGAGMTWGSVVIEWGQP